MDNLISQILTADARSIESILKAVLQRYAQLYPQWDVSVISLEKEKIEKNKKTESSVFLSRAREMYDTMVYHAELERYKYQILFSGTLTKKEKYG